MKKLATLAIWLTIAAAAASVFDARDISLGDLLIHFCANNSVTLMLMPSPISCRIAGMPSGVPGTLIIMLARPTAFHSRRASSMRALRVARQIGRDFQADVAVALLRASYTGRSMSAAS